MNSKEISRLTTTFVCISFLFVFFRCTSSQPLSTRLLKPSKQNYNNVDDVVAEFSRMRPLSYSSSDELNLDDNDYEDWLSLLPKPIEEYNEHEKNSRPHTLVPVRRANFWKRANFWRKRANFW
ncbi:unnamed protein product [Rotaria magnacalcarata]|uniref:Uncharacterized protein n=1 Tax=Rotaria magnacalcarata TaxID=392030 RepID=A0A815H514_9BILA|nr:unnamed protein product [Rotaria magnacalcarata]CAF1347374.1 unnamed protein product [Rotaria magnacalcarata]CAF1983180.1 unnamed protein product [Rotaria magnacalcarata]CAF2080314.1 unnamed protein product [Rotaria magnacalcarata]CAF2121443.1 unnamed protein product [Rotaria magnacalcarata]